MADKYYAWSNFRLEMNEWGQVTKTLAPGEEVTQETLGVGDEEWQDLIDTGAVRTDEYPDVDANTPPAQAPQPVVEEESAIKELRLPKAEEAPAAAAPAKPATENK